MIPVPPIGLMAKKGSFLWSETFPDLPSDGVELRDFMGFDGTVSADLGEQAVSHFAMMDRTTPWEIGARRDLAVASGGVMTNSSCVAVNDTDFWGGTHNVLEMDTINDAMALGKPDDFPSTSNGSLSFMFGGVFVITDTTATGSGIRYLLHSRSTGSPFAGWALITRTDLAVGRVDLRIGWQDGSANQVTLLDAYAQDVPFVIFGVFDFFNDEIRIYSSGVGADSIVSNSASISVPASTFHVSGRDVICGSWNFGSNEGFIGRCAGWWTAEWSNGIDDGLGEANILQFLKKADGAIGLTTPQNQPVQGTNPATLTRCYRNPNTNVAGIGYRERGTFPNIQALNGSGDFTIEFWFYEVETNTHTCVLATQDPNVTSTGWSLRFDHATTFSTALIQFRSALGTTPEISPRPGINAWHHIALTRNSGTCQWYQNGSTIGSSFAYAGAITASSNPLVLCGTPRKEHDGEQDRLADVRIWDVARSAGQISSNYNVKLNGNEANLVAYWPLQQNSLDYGPNGYHLNLLGANEFMAASNGPVP